MNSRPFLLLLLLLTLSACAPSNYVRLSYLSEEDAQTLETEVPEVTVVELADKRKRKYKQENRIGLRSDNTPFYGVSNVGSWISKALEQELSRRGVVTRYVKAASEAQNAQHVLTGSVTEVWLKQRTNNEYSARLVIAVQLNDNPQTTFTSDIIRQDLPLPSITEETMTESLRNLMDSVVPNIVKQLTTKQ